MVSTRHFRREVFENLTEYRLREFDDPEAKELLESADRMFRSATKYESKGEIEEEYVTDLYSKAASELESLDAVLSLDKNP